MVALDAGGEDRDVLIDLYERMACRDRQDVQLTVSVSDLTGHGTYEKDNQSVNIALGADRLKREHFRRQVAR